MLTSEDVVANLTLSLYLLNQPVFLACIIEKQPFSYIVTDVAIFRKILPQMGYFPKRKETIVTDVVLEELFKQFNPSIVSPYIGILLVTNVGLVSYYRDKPQVTHLLYSSQKMCKQCYSKQTKKAV